MADRKARALTVVEGGAEPAEPAKKVSPKKRAPAKPRTLEHASKLTRKTMLETLRGRIAAAIDDPRAHPRDVGALAKQLLDVQAQIDALSAKGPNSPNPTEPSAVADTPNEAWDEDAV